MSSRLVGLGEHLDRVALPDDAPVANDEVAPVLRQPRREEVRLVEQQADRPLEQRLLELEHLPRGLERLGRGRGRGAPRDLLERVVEVDARCASCASSPTSVR